MVSDYARELAEHKYDAFATDRAYQNQPSGRLGPVGWLVDWLVLHQDIHAALRQRLVAVVMEASAAVRASWAGRAAEGVRDESPVRLVSAPCGLGRDLRLTWLELGLPEGRLEVLGLDLDERGDVLPTARAKAERVGLPLATARCDLLDLASLQAALGPQPVDVFQCIGLSVWLTEAELETLLANIHDSLRPGGWLVVDHFRSVGTSMFARDFEMQPFYHARPVFEGVLARSGFRIESRQATRAGVNVVYRCRRPA